MKRQVWLTTVISSLVAVGVVLTVTGLYSLPTAAVITGSLLLGVIVTLVVHRAIEPNR
ncbi:hypothetical protein [Sciscionella marina]|uniref:hypothetical protein n=1 Tax=Sciscionella marina TaxID=508770 RepID=UPI00037EB341|nr:hypothetical protein [Sciscionella marina]